MSLLAMMPRMIATIAPIPQQKPRIPVTSAQTAFWLVCGWA